MAIEFPEGFPFHNTKTGADEAADMIDALQKQAPALAEATPEERSALRHSKADFDFEAAIADDIDVPGAPAIAMEMTAAVGIEPARSSSQTRQLSKAGVKLAAAVAAAQDPEKADKPAAPKATSGRDRRRAPRQTLVAKATVRSEAHAVVVASGFLSNISMSGVGFHTRKPLRVGDKYQLRVEVGPMRWASRMRVVSCMAHGETYDVGAEFVGNELSQLTRREIAA